MKFIKECTEKGVRIPKSALALSGFRQGEPLEVRAVDQVLVTLKKHMTAMELVQAAQSLQDQALELLLHLSSVCGGCENCGGEGCPIPRLKDGPIDLPGYVRQAAGIPWDAKLSAVVDAQDQSVTLCLSEHKHDLWDLPKELAALFQAAGLCLADLEELLMTGEVVYG